MTFFNHIIRKTRFFILTKTIFLLLILMSACKSEDDIMEEDFPKFGTCESVIPKGSFSISDSKKGIFKYETSGGGIILVDPANTVIISHKDYSNFNLVFWGTSDINGQIKNSGNHENLNGKHIKDRIADKRTIIFPDGAKMTMFSDGEFGPMLSISIYDGAQIHHFNPGCNTLTYSSANSPYIKQLDEAEVDGETCTFEFTETGLLFLNIYTEDVAGQKVEERIPLGEIFKDNLNRIDDYYDDPRLGHT